MIVAVACIVAGVIAFATFRSKSSSSQLPAVAVWGTFPKDVFDRYVSNINNTLADQITVNYTQETTDNFLRDFVSALARGNGPDAILIPADLLLPNRDKLTPVPYTVLPQRTFLNTYIDEASIYLDPNGVLGIPFIADPLVTYWNRDMFNAAGLVMCADPSCKLYWDQFSSYDDKITIKDDNGTVTKTAVALGDFANVNNAREIFASILMQSGNPITAQSSDGSVSSAIKTSYRADPSGAVKFFAKFVNPSDKDYSWNRSWPAAKTAFLAGNLATYFGLASELSELRAKNPNLNFDIAPFPQFRTGGVAAAYAKLYGFSLVKSSAKTNAAYSIISILAAAQNLPKISSAMYLPSVSRAVIAAGFDDPYLDLFNRSALISRTWLDPDPVQTAKTFGTMIQSVTSGQKNITQAVNDAGDQFNAAIRQAVGQ